MQGGGKEPPFLRGLDDRKVRFVADVHKDQAIYLEAPCPAVAQWTGRGRRPKRLVSTAKSIWVDPWAQARYGHLMVRRETGATELSHYCLSNASAQTEPKELARVRAQRFFIEHTFREPKASAAWRTTKYVAGMPGITTWLW